MSILSQEHLYNEQTSITYLESIIWPDGAVCPKCRSIGCSYKLQGKTCRPGLRKCSSCNKQYTVKIDTIFQSSKVPLHKWLQAIYLLVSSKKGISTHQLHRTLEVTYKTAWFMAHRIREAMLEDGKQLGKNFPRMVEIDETYIGGKEKNKHWDKKMYLGTGGINMKPVISFMQRGTTNKVRSFYVERPKVEHVRYVLYRNVHRNAHLITDEAKLYKHLNHRYAGHSTVKHKSKEYVRGEIYTNTVENYFSVLKRGIIGVYSHVSTKHLQRYLYEFDFRYNHKDVKDVDRVVKVVAMSCGKRLKTKDLNLK